MVKRPVITLNMIVKDEEKTLGTAIKSVKDFVSEVIIVDTGSKDCTVQVAKDLGATVDFFKWCDDFSAARNYALSLVRTPWCLWIDADDIVLNPEVLPEITEVSRRHRINGIWSTYIQDESSQQRRLQVFKTKDFRWVGVVHENPSPKNSKLCDTWLSPLSVLHRKPHERRPEAAKKYLEILESKDPNNWFGIAESYRFLAIHPEKEENRSLYQSNALECFLKASQAPGVNGHTQYLSLFYAGKLCIEIAKSSGQKELLPLGTKCLQAAHQLMPHRAEAVTLLGLVYQSIGDFDTAKKLLTEAMRLPIPDEPGLVLKHYYKEIPTEALEVIKEKSKEK